ncbi:hypothetical protein [Dankookia sp. P2]|uniref:hypothetical protein n=1 Tax=Dankookia sp. P2 TaxID=3423955 RepID=UPI003D66C4E8
MPLVPEGDLLRAVGRLRRLGETIGTAAARLEAGLRAWPAAGLALLALVLALSCAMLAAVR